MRNPNLWALAGALLLALGMLGIVGDGARVASIVAGILLLGVAVSRILSTRTGERSQHDRYLPPGGFPGGP